VNARHGQRRARLTPLPRALARRVTTSRPARGRPRARRWANGRPGVPVLDPGQGICPADCWAAPSPDGAPCSRSSAGHRFTKLCKRAGLGPGWTRYDASHTFASQLSHGGIDIEVIADAMGHANSNVTRTVYRHGLADRISAAAAAFDRIKLA
jgi:integrase